MEYTGSTDDRPSDEGSLTYKAEEAWISYNPDDLLDAIRAELDDPLHISGTHLDLVFRAFVSGYLTAMENLVSGEQ